MSRGTKKVLILSLIILATAGSAFGFMLYYSVEQGDKLSTLLNNIEAERSQQNDYQKLKKIITETETEREALNQVFLKNSSDSIDLLNYIEETATSTGVTLKIDSVEPVKVSEEEWLEISASFFGEREMVENYLKILETLPYVSRVESVELESRQAGEWSAKITMQVRIFDHD